jgi:GNAT superfamily N-acetyltransferase
MSELTIRVATSADAPALADLPWWDPSGPSPDFAPDLARWMDDNPAHTCMLAFLDEKLVGMAWLAVVARVPRPGKLDRRSGDIQSVFVLPEARRSGVATALLNALDELATSQGLLHQSVHSSAMGIPLYESVGFVATPKLMRKPDTAGR